MQCCIIQLHKLLKPEFSISLKSNINNSFLITSNITVIMIKHISEPYH